MFDDVFMQRKQNQMKIIFYFDNSQHGWYASSAFTVTMDMSKYISNFTWLKSVNPVRFDNEKRSKIRSKFFIDSTLQK